MDKPSLFLFSPHYCFHCGLPNGYTDALSVFAGKTGFFLLRDRFGFLNQYSPYRLYEPHLPMYDTGFTTTLADIMDKRADELLALSRKENRDLFLFVSGGVDSTAMTVAMLKAACGDYRSLHVVYTKYSVEEYPEFFHHLRSVGIDMRLVLPGKALNDAQDEAVQEGYALTGWCADQLFGSQINLDYPDWYFKDWREWIGFPDAIEQLESAFRHYGFPIKTLGEFTWFMNFSCKYDFVKYSAVLMSGKYTERMLPFYDTPEFNAWSVSNFDMLHKYPQQDAEHYKAQLKDYIFAYNGDSSYRANKGKEGSWGHKNDNDSLELWKLPAMVVVMETPTSAWNVTADVELPLFDKRHGAISRTIAHMVLNEYLRGGVQWDF